MHQGDENDIRRKAYEIWESEGRPEGRQDEHWRRAHETFNQDKHTAEISGETSATATPNLESGDGTPDVSAADQPGDMHPQDKAMIPENSAQVLTQTAQPEPSSKPTPPAKRPRTQRKKTPAT
jgi:hypothetical protein